MEVGDRSRSIGQVGDRFPRIIRRGVAEPMNKILEARSGAAAAIEARIQNGLHLIFRMGVREEIRWGTGIVGTVGRRIPIGG